MEAMHASFKCLFAVCAAVAACVVAGCRGGEGDAEAAGGGSGGDGPLVLAFMPDIPPYAYQDRESGELRGVDLDIVRAAARKLGRELEVRQVPFAGLLPAVKAGVADFAASGITITDGRKHDADFSDPYAEEGCAFLYRAGDPPPTMITAEGLRVGVVESMFSDFYLTRHGIEPFRYAGLPELVEALADGRLDAVFYDRPALAIEAEAAGGAFAVTPLETRELYGIAVRKGRPDLLGAVNAAIRERNRGKEPR